jgi:putative transposase
MVAVGVAHHITQRGTDRQTVFYSRGDRRVYLDLLRQNAARAQVRVLAYCLMRNHIHLIAIPGTKESLAIWLRRTHGRYAQYLNARRGRSGHLWQNRFYSCALEHTHLNNALRYVEMNPVRAKIVEHPEEYFWSSAAAHLEGEDPQRLLDLSFWRGTGGSAFWRELLYAEDDEDQIRKLRAATYAGRPLGSEEFSSRVRAGGKSSYSASNAI